MPTGNKFKLLNCEVDELGPFDLIDIEYMSCIYNSLKGLAELIKAISEGLIEIK